MPRGERSGDPDVLTKRRATYARKRRRDAELRARRTLRRHVPDIDDRAACQAWLAARNVRLEDPAMTPAKRLQWVRRAKQAMV